LAFLSPTEKKAVHQGDIWTILLSQEDRFLGKIIMKVEYLETNSLKKKLNGSALVSLGTFFYTSMATCSPILKQPSNPNPPSSSWRPYSILCVPLSYPFKGFS
jgi:hypothetical protein